MDLDFSEKKLALGWEHLLGYEGVFSLERSLCVVTNVSGSCGMFCQYKKVTMFNVGCKGGGGPTRNTCKKVGSLNVGFCNWWWGPSPHI